MRQVVDKLLDGEGIVSYDIRLEKLEEIQLIIKNLQIIMYINILQIMEQNILYVMKVLIRKHYLVLLG